MVSILNLIHFFKSGPWLEGKGEQLRAQLPEWVSTLFQDWEAWEDISVLEVTEWKKNQIFQASGGIQSIHAKGIFIAC